MSLTRRETLLAALSGAVALATPQSVLALELADDKRFLIVELADGNYLAIDRTDKRVLVLHRRPADGEYALARKGVLIAAKGKLVSLREPAATDYHTLTRSGDAVTVRDTHGRSIARVKVE